MKPFLKLNKNTIINAILIKVLIISVKAYNSCYDYCLNDEQCFEDCFSYHRNMGYEYNYNNQMNRMFRPKRYIQYYNGIKEHEMNGLYCGQRLFHREVLPYSALPTNRNDNRLVGGVEAATWEFPWMVSLQRPRYYGGHEHFCGGAIINDYYILTAAHCADNFVGLESTLKIVIGTNDIALNEGTAMGVSKIIVHEKWDRPENLNDIALYRTDRPIKYKLDKESGRYKVNSICLPQANFVEPDMAEVAGWGQTSSQSATVTKLLKISVPKYSSAKCRKNYQNLGKVTDKMICFGGMGAKDSCMGDSGGPLMELKDRKYYVFGLVSYGIPCAVKFYPTIYTKITDYLKWIEKNMK